MITVASKLAVAVALFTGATAAFAATPTVESLSVSVRYDDLNLTTSAGVNSLYQRISAAAREVCPDIYSRDLALAAAAQRCKAQAVTKAVNEIHNSQLALLHAERASHG